MTFGRALSRQFDMYQLRPVLWTLLGTGLSRGSIIVANVFVARHVTQSAFGGLGIMQSTVGMLGVLAGFGVGMATTKYVAEMRNLNPAAVGSVLGVSHIFTAGLGVSLTILLYSLAPSIALHVFGDPRLEPLLRASALLVTLGALNSVQTSAIIGFERWVTLAKLGALSGIATVVLVIAGTVHLQALGAILGLTMAQAVTVAVSHLVLRRMTWEACRSHSWRFQRRDLHIAYAFGLPTMLGTLTFALADWAAPILLVRRAGGLEQMALVNAANQWMALMVFLPIVIGRTWMPAMCTSLARGDQRATSQLLFRAIFVTATATAPLLFGVGYYAAHVMAFYGPAYESSGTLLVIVLLGGTVMALVKPAEYLVYAAGAVWPNLGTCTVYAAAYIGGTALVASHGASGLVGARLSAIVLQSALVFWLAWTIASRQGSRAAATTTG